MLLFLFLLQSFSLTTTASENSQLVALASDPVWLSLIHQYKDRPDISDSNFYIKHSYTNSTQELIDTYNEFFINNNAEALCRFPARYYFLLNKLKLSPKDLKRCTDFNEFLSKAPADKMAIVFTSENISMPTSMMGHIFLKLSGVNSNGIPVNHAISFFTDVDRLPFYSLVVQSLITGMDGVYSLAPYEDIKNNYLYNEQRNLWEYELQLDDFQKTLLQYHLFELRNIQFKYFFHVYNCATVMNTILSIAFPDVADDRSAWVTPLDVIRSVNKRNHIKETSVVASSAWKIKSIQDSINIKTETIKHITSNRFSELSDLDPKKSYLNLELAKSYNDFQFENNLIPKERWTQNLASLKAPQEQTVKDGYIDLSHYKLPAKTPQDSQYLFYTRFSDHRLGYGFNFLPVSHRLEDDNSNYSNESELKLGELGFIIYPHHNKFIINNIVLYSATSLSPRDHLLNPYSGKLEFGLTENISTNIERIQTLNLSGGPGYTFRLSRDIDNYYLADLSINYWDKLALRIGPEVGFIIREIFSMKTILSFKHEYIGKNHYDYLNSLNLKQAIHLGNYSIIGGGSYYSSATANNGDFTLGFKKIF